MRTSIQCFVLLSITHVTIAWHYPCYTNINCPKRTYVPKEATTEPPDADSDIVKAGFHFTCMLLFLTIVFSFFGGVFICGALCANHGGVRPLNQVKYCISNRKTKYLYKDFLFFSVFDLNLSHRLVHGNLSRSVTFDGSIKSLFISGRWCSFNVSNSSVFPSICHLRAKLVHAELHTFTSPA